MSDNDQIDVTSDKMPEDLKTKLEQLPPFARRYAEYRAKGLKQSEAAKKAGSQGSTKAILSRVGWNTEQLDGVKDYILWLEHKRAKAAVIDDLEIIEGFRDVYKEAMMNGKYAEANKAMEHLGNMVGAFAYKNAPKDPKQIEQEMKEKTKNNTDAFTQDSYEEGLGERAKKLQSLIESREKNKQLQGDNGE